MGKYLIIDGVEYKVPIIEMKRKGDVLDLEATRTEDGILHRDVIGTYYNYTLTIGQISNKAVHEALWWVLTAPVPSHQIQLPYQPEAFEGYFGSVQDEIFYIDANGYRAKGLSCNLIATRPSRKATDT